VPPQRLATVLKELRQRARLTKTELARQAEITPSYVSLLESGKRANPSIEVLKRLAGALGVPVMELLE